MLDRLRQGAKGWVSKLLIGLLVLSFAIWGISGQFSGYGAGTLATVGDEEVTVAEFARLQEQYQRAGRQVSPEQVLNQLILNAALRDRARKANLGVSDDRIASQIAADPAFQGPGGAFDRDRLEAVLRNAGFSRDEYVSDVRGRVVRSQIAGSVAAGVSVPQPIVEALYRFQNEERDISFVVVNADSIEPVGMPDDETLQAYFEDNAERFRAPEYRKIGLLVLDPAAISDPQSIPEEEVAAEYERRRASLSRPERRRVEQIRFDSREAAEQAVQSLNSGSGFEAVAQNRGLTPAELDQGLKTKAEFLDPTVAEAAFAAEPNTPVAVLETTLEPSIIRVTEIEPGSVTPIEEAAPRIRQDLAVRAARDQMQDLYDRVEDERAGGASLQDVASSIPLPYRTVEAVSAEGRAPDGSTVADLPARQELLRAAFESDIGLENNPIRAENDALVFYEVLEIIPERDRTLDEVRQEVVSAWQAQEAANRIAELADASLNRLQAGEPLSTVAADLGQPVQTVENVRRGSSPAGLSANALAQAFAGPEGHVANAEADTPPDRILLRVDQVTAPAFFAEAADAQAIRTQLASALTNDLLQSFNREVLQDREARINNAAFSQLTGTPNLQ